MRVIKPDESRNMWRISRHGAGVQRRILKLTHGPLKRLRCFQHEGYCRNSMGLCYQRRLKLSLSNRKICVVRYIIVVVKEEVYETEA